MRCGSVWWRLLSTASGNSKTLKGTECVSNGGRSCRRNRDGNKSNVATLVIDGGKYGSEPPKKSPDGRKRGRVTLPAQRLGSSIPFAVSRTRVGSRRGATSGDAPSRFHHPTHAGLIPSEDQEHSRC